MQQDGDFEVHINDSSPTIKKWINPEQVNDNHTVYERLQVQSTKSTINGMKVIDEFFGGEQEEVNMKATDACCELVLAVFRNFRQLVDSD